MKRLPSLLLVIILGLTSGCAQFASLTQTETPTPQPPVVTYPVNNPYEPQVADAGLLRTGFDITTISLLAKNTDPPQIVLILSGTLPSPCHTLRARVSPPDAAYQVHIELYSVTNPDLNCTAVLKQFEAEIPLGSYSPGLYDVWINGQYAGNFYT